MAWRRISMTLLTCRKWVLPTCLGCPLLALEILLTRTWPAQVSFLRSNGCSGLMGDSHEWMVLCDYRKKWYETWFCSLHRRWWLGDTRRPSCTKAFSWMKAPYLLPAASMAFRKRQEGCSSYGPCTTTSPTSLCWDWIWGPLRCNRYGPPWKALDVRCWSYSVQRRGSGVANAPTPRPLRQWLYGNGDPGRRKRQKKRRCWAHLG